MASDVIVVGSGIAGLTAAWYLKKAGFAPVVLESDSRVGGRMTSDKFDGFVMDRGAQFLSSGYKTLIPLIGEVGLARDLRPTSPLGAIVRDSRVRRIDASNPFSLLNSGLLSLADFLRMGWRSLLLAPKLRRLPLDDYAAWTGLDDATADAWFRKHLGETVTDYLIEPQLQGLYFQAPEETSRAIAHMLLAFGLAKSRTLTLAGGIGSLPEAIAERVTVKLDEPVREIRQDGNAVVVTSAKSEYRPRWCVSAVPATTAKTLINEPDGRERGLLDTGYSTTINIGIGLGPGFSAPPVLQGVYGLLIPKRERRCIAAISLESNKDSGRVPGGELLDVMLSGDAGRRMIDRPDPEIESAVLDELETYFPGAGKARLFTRIVRWRDAEPLSPVGRSSLIADYRAGWTPGRRILLAGDYVGFPYTDSAAHSGKWAAEKILQHDG